MADEQLELRRVSWTEVFSFTHIFKSFRMAIHPSKLLLGLAAVILVVVLGLVMDWLWYAGGSRSHISDPLTYFQAADRAQYKAALDKEHEQAIAALVADDAAFLNGDARADAMMAVFTGPAGGDAGSELGKQLTQWIRDVKVTRAADTAANLTKKAHDDLDGLYDQHVDTVNEVIKDIEPRIDNFRKGDPANYAAAQRMIWQVRRAQIDQTCVAIHSRGNFMVFSSYESQCFSGLISSVWHGNFTGGTGQLMQMRGQLPEANVPVGNALANAAVAAPAQGIGLVGWLILMLAGVTWLVGAHPFYAIVFLLGSLSIWAIFGGAIARIAALHAAREEKISISQAVRFSASKFFSFFSAPLIPLVLIGLFAFLMGVGGIATIWTGANIVLGILFVLALVLGALVAFLAVGLGAGLPLMYPTIAVEGSDSFDAISRSFSYAFARPWRYALYSLVAVVYGALCYLFVRFFAFLTLLATHLFVSKGILGLAGAGTSGAPELAPGATKLDLLWARPTFDQLAALPNWAAMGWSEKIASAFIHGWVYLVVGLVVAFVLTFAVSSHTVIYYLLRRKVDATDLDDVYVEELEEPEEEEAAEPEAGQASAPAEPTAAAGSGAPSGTTTTEPGSPAPGA